MAINPFHTDSLPLLYRYRDELVTGDLLCVAIAHLDLFSWLAETPSTFAAICQNFALKPRPADVMMSL
ncbi:MAG: hypothetical protein J6386_13870 [Candidatus Synoicihabitans palmerolidicus]|nr:hypothetical protein [Candidatus Synoicihabitans palmerolidicus]